MVKLGFIVEGELEKIILESPAFRRFLESLNVNFIADVIDVKGGGNLLPHKREESIDFLKEKGATHILIIADKENAPCITSVKERIAAEKNQFVVVSVKALEAWYLGDSLMLSNIFRKSYDYEFPEKTENLPIETLKSEFLIHTNRGFGSSKPLLAKKMIREGFDIRNAAKHSNCPSAKYFIDKVIEIATKN